MNSKKKIIIIVLVVIAVILFSAVVGAVIWYNESTKPVNIHSTDIKQIQIEQGMSTIRIIKKLKEEDLIKSELATKVFIKLNNVNKLQAGKYDLSQSMELEKILATISKGDVVNDEIKITFLEGKNMRWIAKKIATETSNTEEQVYELLADKGYISELIKEYWFLTESILDSNIYYPLEGYLYPETYTFKDKNVTVKEIFNVLLKQTEEVLAKYKKYIEEDKFDIHQILTMASIVELEGNDLEARRGIARVILNRLEKNMSLGSDVTTYYAIKVDMGERNLTTKEINTYNAYNTRGPNMNGKLPIGPISTISEESIKCVLRPLNNNYLYFVADKNGKVYFSTTYSEHQNIINKLKQQGLWYTY